MTYEFFERLNKLVPGSVKIDKANSTVTLTGWNLEELINSAEKQNRTDDVEKQTGGFNASRFESEDAFPKNILLIDGSFKWVIDPLSDTNGNAPECNQSRSTSGIFRKHPCSCKEENKAAKSNKYFVPGIKSKLRKWVLQVQKSLLISK